MKGRKLAEYKLNAEDRRYLLEVASEGQMIQRFANRARALLALGRGERIVVIVHWLGIGRTSLWARLGRLSTEVIGLLKVKPTGLPERPPAPVKTK